MKNSRSLDDLHPIVALKARRLFETVAAQGIEMIVVSTLRDEEMQHQLYGIGRAQPGIQPVPARPNGWVVTDNPGGYSFHQYGLAFDAWPIVNGRLATSFAMPEWGVWAAIREACSSRGISLVMGNPKRKPATHPREWWHFQYTAGLSIEDVRKGATLPDVQL